ncbi:MFS transporter [Luteipulveratus mongoliensis]|uniref:Permease n=1 Tax=Luteipulveratus mongoliensis TaxID=571913 RepID=A0A0K1JIX8_9MICO|nr:MFS transporter [Luteipulveratus mongoliensis]AKU16667.1 permease [Luteipulveratus mongoliensis]
MTLAPYRRVLARPRARQILLLGLLLRIPIFGTGVLLTLHVVEHLGRSWKEAGLLSAMATLAIAISGPWRGRLIDRYGLRRVVAPSLFVTGAAWAVAPFVGYGMLMLLATVGGLFVIPIFTVARQGVIAAVPADERRTALSVDGVAVELAYMSGPAVAVWAGTQWGTAPTLLVVQMCAVAGGVVLWWLNPPMREEADVEAVEVPRSSWLRPRFVALCLTAAASTVVLVGSEVAVVAALREWGQETQLGLVFAAWGLGSIIGGIAYGAMSRGRSPYVLLAGLALVTAPMALAGSAFTVAALGLLAGLLCAPTITAGVEAVTRVVPTAARGEAMGWHGSCMTIGSAIGAPVAGLMIDSTGYRSAILVVALVGLLVALGGGAAALVARRERRPLELAA